MSLWQTIFGKTELSNLFEKTTIEKYTYRIAAHGRYK